VGRQQRRYTRSRIALVLTVLIVLAGCASSPPAQQARQTPSSAMPSLTLAQSVLASNAPSLRENWYRNRAEQQLTAQCMKRRGYVYPIPTTGPVPSLNTITQFALGRGYPATYGVTQESLITTPPSDPEAGQPGYEFALDGPASSLRKLNFPGVFSVTYETGGCQGSARSQLYGSVDVYMEAYSGHPVEMETNYR
jgi:hypothetical protein